jgi:hypothetical protein
MVTDITIISEIGRWKEGAGRGQGVMARQDKRRVVALRGKFLKFLANWG